MPACWSLSGRVFLQSFLSRQVDACFELASVNRKEASHVAYVGSRRESLMSHGVVRRHVSDLGDDNEVLPRRHAVALQNSRVLHDAGFEGVQVFGGLNV